MLSRSSHALNAPTPIEKHSRRRRKRVTRFVQTRGLIMDPIPEEFSSNPSRSASLLLPLLAIVATLAMHMGSSPEWKTKLLRRSRSDGDRRALFTLTPDHIDQYPFDGFLDVDEPTPKSQRKVTGFYWQVPRSGGTTLKHIMGTCFRRVQAARTSADYCDMDSKDLSLCLTKEGTFINADPSDHGGIQRAEKLNLISSGMADVIVSSRLLHAATLYSQNHKGRIFTILRHPIDRAVSTFYYLQNADWERHYRPEFKTMTLLEYVALPDTAHNWMVRWLTGKNSEPELTREDLEFSKELLRRKFLILLTNEMNTSVQRLMDYMQWEVDPLHFDATKECLHENISKDQGLNKAKHPMPTKGSPEYEAIRAINELDLELYEFAEGLFVEQWSVLYKGTGAKLNDLFLETFEEDVTPPSDSNAVEATLPKQEVTSELATGVIAPAELKGNEDSGSITLVVPLEAPDSSESASISDTAVIPDHESSEVQKPASTEARTTASSDAADPGDHSDEIAKVSLQESDITPAR